MPYLTAGDPDFKRTVEFALGMIDAGADLLELGIPFSDPTADGPVIQAAMVRALANENFSLDEVFGVARSVHQARPETPLVFLTYLNPIVTGFLARTPGNPALRSHFDAAQNIELFLKECHDAGIKGVVIPDLPLDQPESKLFRKLGKKYEVDQIVMIAPNTRKRHFKEICRLARGFIYYVTSLGVTGERKEFPPELEENVRKVKKTSGLPVLAGFGFSAPDQVRPLRGIVDGVIVGSLNHSIIQQHGVHAGMKLAETTRGFAEALRGDVKAEKNS